jgi:translocator protein
MGAPTVEGAGARSALALAGFVAVSAAPGALGSLATAGGGSEWYQALDKPAFTPPDWVFGPVWSTLYVLTGVAAWLVWRRRRERPGAGAAFAAFGAQLALNAAWTPVFFGLEAPGPAILVIVALWLALAETIRRFRHFSAAAALLLAPYLAWVTFAAALNVEIWRLN